ncbi:MAG: DMT family transporter, partial [Oscillospiraceae bacterium]
RKVFALTLTFAGCLLVTGIATGSGTISRRGVLLGLGAGFGYALYSIFGRVALRKYHTLTITAWTFLMAAAASIPLALADTPCDWSALLTPAGLIGTIGISLVCCTLPYLLYTLGLSGVETGRAAILATIEPAVATLVGIVCFDERMTATKLAGMALIFGAIVLLSQPVRIKNQSKG